MQHSLWKMYSTLCNALLANRYSVTHPYKDISWKVLSVMYKEGYINGFRKVPEDSSKIEIFLKYVKGKPAITKLSALSKPSRRIYTSNQALWKSNSSLQTLILSTPHGILSDKDCRKRHIGGEILCVLF